MTMLWTLKLPRLVKQRCDLHNALALMVVNEVSIYTLSHLQGDQRLTDLSKSTFGHNLFLISAWE
jgi:hypothetical protein